MGHLHSYPEIFNLGHRNVVDLFNEQVVVQEKVDGSQFSFGVQNVGLVARSKGAELIIDAPEKMFTKAVDTIKRLFAEGRLTEGWTYRGEFLQSPHHNTLKYDRVPKDHIILYDVDTGLENYVAPNALRQIADSLGLECVPTLYVGMIQNADFLKAFFETDSILGGTKIEGMVIKNYSRFTLDKKVMMGKLVRPEFKEMNKVEFRVKNPTQGDIIQNIIDTYKNDARFNKAVQHLRDLGILTDSPKDIGPLMREVPADILKECEDEIKEALWKFAWPKIQRGVTAGLPEWYKAFLLDKQFNKE
jgi:hypothetical protein